MSNESEKKEAEKKLKELAQHYAKPYEKKVGEKVQQVAERSVASLGIPKEQMAKALGLAEIARTGKIQGTIKLGKDSEIEGELDVKKKAGKITFKKDF